jgi:pyrroline-5-carboxylate reductase
MTSNNLTSFPAPMLLFGCGNMTGAMVDGWMAAGIDGKRFHIVKPSTHGLPAGAAHFVSAADARQKYQTLMIGIKPQMLSEMAADIRSLLAPNALIISILGGVGTDILTKHFPAARILRVMPNLAVALGKSPLGLFASDLSEADRMAADQWLAPLGTPYWVAEEDDMHAFTAIAGCGPAFLYRFISAVSHAGTQIGIDPEQAEKLAKEMVEGAALLAAQSSYLPDELATRVASKGGSTAAGLAVLDQDDRIRKLMTDTLRAARDRSAEQGKEAE